MQHTTHSSQRLRHLDWLRGLAALLVVLVHTGVTGIVMDPLHLPFELGHFAVCLFFAISGFVITLSVDNTPLPVFWVRRFLRLYPSYWLSLLAIVLLAMLSVARPFSPQFDQTPLLTVAGNITMLQRAVGIDDLLPVYWSLFPEMLFYGLISILIMLRVFRNSVPVALGGIAVAALLSDVLPRLGYQTPDEPIYLAIMVTGMVLYRTSQGHVARRTAFGVATLCVLMIGLSCASSSFILARAAAIPFFALMLHVKPGSSVLVFLGRISYPLYLTHELVIAVIHTNLFWLDILLWISVSILVAWASYRAIERPMMVLARRLSSSARAIPGARAPLQQLARMLKRSL